MMRRSFALLGMTLALAGTAAAPATADQDEKLQARVDLPNGFQPEGIAIGSGATAWFSSLVDGDIYEVDLATGKGAVLAQGPGTPSVGLQLDHRGRLFVAGGSGGDGRVLDTRTGEVLASYKFTTATSFVNDVVLAGGTAWFTDSSNATLYGVPLERGGAPGDADDVTALPLGGEWREVAGFNANGITRTPDHRALLVVQTATGLLYRVDPDTGNAKVVDLGGVAVKDGDGMLRHGRTLYVVEGSSNRVAVFHLNSSGTAGSLKGYLTSADLDFPSTVAASDDFLYLTNARFSTTPTPDTPYWATRIER
ncbi:superoxide dismutase [Georgenia sp. SYP-B2076]|uniref:superoxide dismutase n=1 Tax=Georgenia sp. SYP-B2076 TaxID=2495881 RepID=UPI000F8F5D82|nr:superoxide dismutase [Georgenia sp. SYP-B2076]